MSLFGSSSSDSGAVAAADDDILASMPGSIQVTPKEILEWEKELVGVYVSSHPLQQMTVDLQNVITHATVDITEELKGTSVIIAGLIADVRTITTKKGETMAFIKLEDLQGAVDLTVFPQLFKDKRHLWTNDKIVVIWGKADFRNGRASVVADQAQDYVEGMKIIEDTTSVYHRYRNGQNAPARPTVRQGNGGPAATSAARPQPAPRRPPAYTGDEDDPYGEDVNPLPGKSRSGWPGIAGSRTPQTTRLCPKTRLAGLRPSQRGGSRGEQGRSGRPEAGWAQEAAHGSQEAEAGSRKLEAEADDSLPAAEPSEESDGDNGNGSSHDDPVSSPASSHSDRTVTAQPAAGAARKVLPAAVPGPASRPVDIIRESGINGMPQAAYTGGSAQPAPVSSQPAPGPARCA